MISDQPKKKSGKTLRNRSLIDGVVNTDSSVASAEVSIAIEGELNGLTFPQILPT